MFKPMYEVAVVLAVAGSKLVYSFGFESTEFKNSE